MADISTNILTSLGAGSGIDTRQLVQDLVAAERAQPQARLDARRAAVEAKISAQGQFLSALDALTTALGSRISSGSLSGVPQVSNPSVLSMEVAGGAEIPLQEIGVERLARGQTLASAPVADSSEGLGTGEIRIRFGAVAGSGMAEGFEAGGADDLVINVTEGADSLVAIRNLINANAIAKGAPITAQIVSDETGDRLMLRGATGAEQGFLVETSGAPGLDILSFNADGTGGMERTTVAANARLTLNGVTVERADNTITDLVEGATIRLLDASPDSIVTVQSLRDASALSGTVSDLVGALNELQDIGKSLTARGTDTSDAGALATDSAAKRALRSLAALVRQEIPTAPEGGPRSLSDLGVSIDRSGKFIVDEARLAEAARLHPEALAAIVSGLNSQKIGTTPEGPLRAIASQFRISATGSAGQPSATLAEQQRIADDQQRLDARIERVEARYTSQFVGLDRMLSVIRGQQDFLQQQIDMWTKKDS